MHDDPAREPRQALESHFPLIRRIVDSLARRQGLDAHEADEFFATVLLRFVESGYAPLVKFRGASSFKTYLTTVIHRQFLDYRVRLWGRWRPSAVARSRGAVAVRLDRLINRDRLATGDAIAVLRCDPTIVESDDELAELARQLPDRRPPRFEGEETLRRLASDLHAEEALLERHRDRLAAKAQSAVARALARLSPEERLIFKLRFRDGLKVRTIATTLELDPSALYRRFAKCLGKLRQAVADEGLTREEALEILGWAGGGLDLDRVFAAAEEESGRAA